MTNTYIFYSDSGHAWLRVRKEEVKSIKNQISQHSYENGDYVYLEEDCDAVLFINHKFGSIEAAKPHISERHSERSRIRSYKRYNSDLI